MIALVLVVIGTILYWIGGQKWAHTLFRDLGCTVCMFLLAWHVLGWHWSLCGTIVAWGGFTIGDHEKLYWSPHGFVIGLGMALYGIVSDHWLILLAMLATVTVLTYIVSRFLNKLGIDVILRGLLYATIPLWFKFASLMGAIRQAG